MSKNYNDVLTKEFLIQKYVDEKLSQQQIADLIGCGYGTVHRYLKIYEIPKRNMSEALTIDANRPEKLEWSSKNISGNRNPAKRSSVRRKISASAKLRTGAKNPNFKPAHKRKVSINISIRQSLRYKQWRTEVYKRDGFICQVCFKRGGRLNADHIKPFSAILKENKIKTLEQSFECAELWDTKNGRTLCVKCHKKTDTYGRGAKKYLRKT